MADPYLMINAAESELVRAFDTAIQRSLIYIERTCLDTGETVSGTGTVIGYQGNSTDGWLPYIASAGHVLRSTTDAKSRFRLQQFSWSDPARPSSRALEFETGAPV